MMFSGSKNKGNFDGVAGSTAEKFIAVIRANKPWRLLVLCSLPLLLNGCAGLLVSGATQTGVAVAENRSIGRKVDDTVIYTDLTNQFLQADQAALLGHVTFNVRYGRVMLTGNIPSEEEAARAAALSWKAKGVTEVINELVVNPDKTLIDTAGDAIIKRNLEARLLITKGVWVINYSIDVINGTAYLIGRVKDQPELDRALNVARSTKGVKRVVSHLQINADVNHAVTSAEETPAATRNATSDSSSGSSNSGSDVYTGPVYGSSSTGTVSAPESVESAPLNAPKEPVGGGY
jgi:osmotically-inducible protein OsmY